MRVEGIEAYDFIKAWAKPGEFAGWFDISLKPPTKIHVLIYIKDWGAAIGMLLEDNMTFRCYLPHENSPTCLEINRSRIMYWAVIPTLIEGLRK